MLVLVLRRGNQFDILLTESLPKISYFANKRSVLATNELDTEDIFGHTVLV